MSKVVNDLLLEARRLENWDNSEDIKELLSVIKDGKILEIGCGTGRIIEDLSKNLQKSFFVGIDIVDYFLEIATKKEIKNAIFMKVNATERIFQDKTFNIVLFRDSIHEIRENSGEKGVETSLENAYYTLKDSGITVIRESIVAPQKKIKVTFATDKTREVFSIFSEKFMKIPLNNKKDFTELEANDLVSFLGKFKKIETNQTIEKPREPKKYSLEEYDQLLAKLGFKKLETRLYKLPRTLIPKGISLDFNELPNTYCMLIYQK